MVRYRDCNILLWTGVLLVLLALWGHGDQETATARASGDNGAVTIYLPLVHAPPSQLLIAAAHIDSARSGEPDEAVMLWNSGAQSEPLAGWVLATRSRTATFPLTTTLMIAPGQRLWCAAAAAAFRQTFGEAAACEWAEDSEAAAVDLAGKLSLANTGGVLQLRAPSGVLIDTLAYGTEEQPVDGWLGAPAQQYDRGELPSVGQVWQRKFDPLTQQPLDNDLASDWAGDLTDLAWGRRVRMPGWGGWDAADLGIPPLETATASVSVMVGPEGFYAPLAALLQQATTSIDLEIYTLEHPELAQLLADAAHRGVHVRILLEGSAAGGVTDLERWCVAQIVAAGGDVRFLAVADDAPTGYRARYRFVHAKFMLIDDRLALNGTENFGYDSFPLPTDTPSGGRRGYYLVTDAEPVVRALRHIFTTDWAPDRFFDVRPFEAANAKYGLPPADFVPPPPPAYPADEAPFAAPAIFSGTARFSVISAPENTLRPDAGLMRLLLRAGPGDEIYVEQLYEHKHWGLSTSNVIADPNPRLQALIDAARRGARVRLLLDSFFDEPNDVRNNIATLTYLNAVAAAEGLDLAVRMGNPTAGGIHAKLHLFHVGGEMWSAIGSLNGSEISNKLNREVVVMTDLAGVYEHLVQVFAWDWERSS